MYRMLFLFAGVFVMAHLKLRLCPAAETESAVSAESVALRT